MAWHVAALGRAQKRLPKLSKLLIREPRRQRAPQTSEQMLAVAKMWTAALGGTIPKHLQG